MRMNPMVTIVIPHAQWSGPHRRDKLRSIFVFPFQSMYCQLVLKHYWRRVGVLARTHPSEPTSSSTDRHCR
jgi:hypothetical protein